MSDIKKIKYEYFEVVARASESTENSLDEKFDFVLWIDKINKIPEKDRVKNYFEERAKLERVTYNYNSAY